MDTTMWIASCTKLMTAISVLQCVERGLLKLDEDISPIIPEFKTPLILTGFEPDSGKPILQPAKNKITLRMLLNHSSGLCLPMMNNALIRWAKHEGRLPTKPGSDPSLYETCYLPLLFEPGTRWAYGNGLEWAGEMVARVSGMRLDSFMSQNIWTPLGMKSTSFRLAQRPDIAERLADMTFRLRGTKDMVRSNTHWWSKTMPDDHGGAGVWSCASDYTKLLSALLRADCPILSQQSIDLLFATPSLSPASKTAMAELIFNNPSPVKNMNPFSLLLAGGIERDADLDYALGGMVNNADAKTKEGKVRRPAGCMSWSGMPSLEWVVDRRRGVALFLGMQLVPPGDGWAVDVWERFEEAVMEDGVGGDVAREQEREKARL
jgi:hypothetical protein